MGMLLTTASVLMCPHGGTVTPVTSNARAQADGAFVLRPSDVFTVAGCANPAGPPHLCASVQWLTAATRASAAGDAALSSDSVGLCIAADGAPNGSVNVVSTQTRVAGQ